MTVYGVKAFIYDSGKISTTLLVEDYDNLPENVYEEHEKYDMYIDYFSNKNEAMQCIKDYENA